MASYRIGIGSFNLKDGNIGIGTETTGFGNLKVEGTLKTSDLDVGVSTFTRYSGFEGEEAKFDKDVDLSGEYSTTGDIVVEPGATLTVGLGSTACIGSVECISVKHHFSVPVGDTAGRNKSSGYTEGTVRYNRDLGTMEFFNGNEWRQFTYIADIKTNPQGRGRAVFGGGYTPSSILSTIMDFVNIHSLGNANSFGDLNHGGASKGTMGSNGTRGLFMGGYWPASPTKTDQIDYITIPSGGDSIDFGDLTNSNTWGAKGASSSTRGIRMGGYPSTDVIDYVEINTLGNALDFGNLTVSRYSVGALASSTKIFGGGGNASSTEYSVIDMITTSSKGNAIDDGDLRNNLTEAASASNSVRGIWAGGSASFLSDIQYRTLSSSGNAEYFGDLSVGRRSVGSGASTQTRMVIGGGRSPAVLNLIEFVTIASAGNANDFGDLSEPRRSMGALSDSHGGLGGF